MGGPLHVFVHCPIVPLVVGAIAAIIRICARVARVSAVCEESEGASGARARSGYTRGGEGDAELAWAGSEAANGLGVEGPRQGCACLRRSEGALEEYARKRTHARSERGRVGFLQVERALTAIARFSRELCLFCNSVRV
jgi:hypothetical protein